MRDNLIKKGLVYGPGWGQIAFTVPHFAAYLRRKYPAWKDRDPRNVAAAPAADTPCGERPLGPRS